MIRAIFTRVIMSEVVSFSKRIRDVSEHEKSECFRLLSSQFLDIRREDFERDLAEKHAILFLAAHGAIVGFSTIMTLPLPVAGRRTIAIFSGDTAVDPRYRFSSGPLRELGAYFLRTLDEFHGCDVWYILISKGWRTYKLLPSLFRSYWPSPEPTPAAERAVIDAFGASKYPHAYDAAAGTIRAGAGAPRLRPESIDVAPAKLDPATAFFLRANPRYLDGDELVCAGRVTPANFAAPLRRILSTFDADLDRLDSLGAPIAS